MNNISIQGFIFLSLAVFVGAAGAIVLGVVIVKNYLQSTTQNSLLGRLTGL